MGYIMSSCFRSISSSHRRGFTLIELLVVIAVIAILASLLIPVIGSVQRKARAAESLSNLRQIVAATFLYAGEHDGRFHEGWGYERKLQPYLTDPMAARTLFTSPNADKQPTVVGSMIPITYSVHGYLMWPVYTNNGTVVGYPLGIMHEPHRLVLIGDGIQAPGNFWQANFHLQNPNGYIYADYNGLSENELDARLENNSGPRGWGPDEASGAAGWFRYCNNGAVAVGYGDGGAGLIPKGEVIARNLVP